MSQLTITMPKSISWPRVALAAAIVAVAVAFVVPASREAIGRTWEPRRVADRTVLVAQRQGVEQSFARVYARGVQQLKGARALVLPLTPVEADAIVLRWLDQLAAVRHNALLASARIYGLGPNDADAYVKSVEPQLNEPQADTAPGLILAPALYQVVARASELSGQAADDGTRELTKPRPSGSPSPSPSRTPAPSGSPAPTTPRP